MGLVADKMVEALSLPLTAEQAVKNVILASHVLKFVGELPVSDKKIEWKLQAEALLQAGKNFVST